MPALQFYRKTSGDPPSALPSWVTGATARTWVTIPGSALSAADPDPGRTAPWSGSGGQASIVSAWGSAWLDPETGLQYITGGGHSNYYGNEFYSRDLAVASPSWTRVSEPSDLGTPASTNYGHGVGTATAYSDGRLRSTHTYNALVWAPGTGPVMAGLSSRTTDGGNGSMALITFDAADGSSTLSSTATSSGSGTPIAACYDATRGTAGVVWIRRTGTSFMLKHDIAADTRSTVGGQEAWSGGCSLAAHPSGDYLLVGNGDALGQTVSGGWCVFDCATGTYYTPTFTGTVSGGLDPGECQPVWVESLGCFCAWDNATVRDRITTLTPGADPFTNDWTISYLSIDGSNAVTPSAAQGAGTYGRFAYWEQAGGFVLFNAADEAGFFFKV